MSKRKTINISEDVYAKMFLYCEQNSHKVGAWVEHIILGALNDNQAPTPKTFAPTPRQEQILASIRPSFNTPLVQHKPIEDTIDGELTLVKDDE